MKFRILRRLPFFRLLLAGAIAFLWVRSHFHSDIFTVFLQEGKANGFLSDRGRMTIFWTNISLGERRAYTYDVWRMTNP